MKPTPLDSKATLTRTGLRISVENCAPARLKVRCSISKTITDEPERSGDSQPQAARRARRSQGKSRARWMTR